MKRIITILLGLALIISLSSCQYFTAKDPSPNGNILPPPEDGKNTDTNNPPESNKAKSVTIYFGDSEAMKLKGEEREISQVTPESLINELIKGPNDSSNSKTIPQDTKLLGIEVNDGIAYVDFSKEIKENHWGGSSGESMTIFSIVNTLSLNSELNIEKVKLLIEGQEIDSLAGHFIVSEPIEPNRDMIHEK